MCKNIEAHLTTLMFKSFNFGIQPIETKKSTINDQIWIHNIYKIMLFF